MDEPLSDTATRVAGVAAIRSDPPAARTVEEGTWQRAFPAAPEQVGRARRFLAGVLAGHPAADDAALCLSELASNAVLHSDSARLGGTFRVRITARSGLLRVEVDDDGGRWRADTRPDGQSGRGLVIVGTVAIAWGVSTAWCVGNGQAGCTVWFELPLT